MVSLRALVLALSLSSAAPAVENDAGKPPVHGTRPSELLSVTEAKGTCFGFPLKAFGEGNSITDLMPHDPTVWMSRGKPAIDFVLMTAEEPVQRHALSELLMSGKPVVLTYGMYTCPAFQGFYIDSAPASHFSKYDEWALVEQYKDKVQFVHLYTAEPHPRQPDANFDKGVPVEFPWSTVRQARSYDMRRKSAKLIEADIHEDAMLLVDDLGEGLELKGETQPSNDPVWCSYGPGARLGVLINSEGVVYNTQAWFHSVTMAVAIEELLLMNDKLASPGELQHLRRDSGVEEAFANASTVQQDAFETATEAASDATAEVAADGEATLDSVDAAADRQADIAADAELNGDDDDYYEGYKPAISISESQMSSIMTRDHQEERIKALSQIRHFTAKYSKFRSAKLQSRKEQGLPPPKSSAKHAASATEQAAAIDLAARLATEPSRRSSGGMASGGLAAAGAALVVVAAAAALVVAQLRDARRAGASAAVPADGEAAAVPRAATETDALI